jgi:hypothetical protein
MKGPKRAATVMRTALCGDCFAEGRPRPKQLGQLLRMRHNGAVVWFVQDRRGITPLLRGPDGARIPMLRSVELGPRELAGGIPTTLPAWCERHGKGTVSMRDVLDGSSACIVIKLS